MITLLKRALCCAALVAVTAQVNAQTFRTSAKYAILMDADTGSVLLQNDADELMSPASLVKIMTAEIVFREIKEGRLRLEDTMTVSTKAWKEGGAGARGSTMFAKVNEQIKIADLLRGLIVQSGNDAAITLAEGISGDESAFAELMTKRAREIGLRDTRFKNAWGKFDPDQKTTARDMAKLAVHVIKTYPDLYKIFGEKEFTWNKIRQLNRNPLLTMGIGADGLKTGNIADAGFGLVGSAVRGDLRLVVVINGMKSARDRAEEGRKLLAWGFRTFDSKDVFKTGEIVGTASVYGGDIGRAPLVSKTPVRVLVPRGSTDRLSGRIEYVGPLLAPIEKGRKVANLRIYRGKELTLDAPLYTAVDIKKGPLHSRAFDAAYEGVVNLVRTYVFKSNK
ncbi:MAG: D-alanyl-D-alanine carboxypeptidase family protein [Beijerinckiaceae bacterium]